MAVFPVRVDRRDGAFSCITYAFIDLGSNISFVSESLPQEIECQGVRKRLSMDTMGVQHMMDSSAIKVIHITELYQKRVTLEFFERLREERPGNSREDKFSSLQSGSQMVTMCSTFHLITEVWHLVVCHICRNAIGSRS